jgi:hypothetical protein
MAFDQVGCRVCHHFEVLQKILILPLDAFVFMKDGSVKQRSARIRYNGQRPSDRIPGRPQSDHVDFLDRQSQVRLKMSSHRQLTGMRYEHQSLINLQSLLCSDYASESLAQAVLGELDACQPDGLRDVELSLRTLCLPKVGFKVQALDLLIDNYPDSLVSYSKNLLLDTDEVRTCYTDGKSCLFAVALVLPYVKRSLCICM